MVDLFEPFIKKCGVVILDGAMATELENRGANLNDPLWSAKLLIENPALIKQVHRDYLRAGADVITTASYQASFDGFTSRGYTKEKAIELMRLATTLALEARGEALQHNFINGPFPLIAASVGPYGASRADGSEYSGNYGLSVEQLMSFHRERIHVLKESGADLLACETIPCAEEAIALMNLMKEFPDLKAWLSFSCKNETEICSGASFKECIAMVNTSKQVVAVGVNCTPPQFVESLVRIAVAVSNKPVLAYPNKGETWDGKNKRWLPGELQVDFISEAIRWRNAGATLIGGCCRTSPEDIRQIRKQLCGG
ncbi:MAG TPA: homocysteine S-methyltransferase [Puia sp.]|jgi:homocysteine S-methyltransferase|nr:homocysteine S-methyltransferase [Puia sp.]